MSELSSERRAENEAVFRDANERIGRRADELGFDEAVPFLCECGDPACHGIVRLQLADYDAVRQGATRFFVISGHETPESEVVERHEGYVIVEKTGEAAVVAARRNPRETAG